MCRRDLTEKFNQAFNQRKPTSAICSYCKRHGLPSSSDGRFKKGGKPWSAGLAGKGILKPNAGSFKKGGKPVTCKPVGSERLCAKSGYILIKTRPGKHSYEHKHRLIWKQAGRDVPPGHVLTFIDGNKLNCTLENLEVITRSESVRRNQLKINEQPPEVRDTIKAIAKLKTLIGEKSEKSQKNQNQKRT